MTCLVWVFTRNILYRISRFSHYSIICWPLRVCESMFYFLNQSRKFISRCSIVPWNHHAAAVFWQQIDIEPTEGCEPCRGRSAEEQRRPRFSTYSTVLCSTCVLLLFQHITLYYCIVLLQPFFLFFPAGEPSLCVVLRQFSLLYRATSVTLSSWIHAKFTRGWTYNHAIRETPVFVHANHYSILICTEIK